MATEDDEEERLRSVALQNAQSILHARRRAEEALRKQSEWLRVTLSSIGDAVISTDAEGRVTFMNGIAEFLTGWPQAEALGRPLPDVFQIINEQSHQPVENPALRALREGVIVGLANHTVLIAKDGTERAIDDSAAPIRTEREVIGCVLVFRDITEQRLADRALRESEGRLRFVMDSMPQKIFTAKPNGDVDYFNPIWTEFTGLTFEQIRDWGWTQFIHPEDVAENVRVWQQSIDTGQPFQFEHRFRRADGEYRWHISRAFPMRDAAGRVLMWIGSNTEIREQRQTANKLPQLAAELSEADRRKNEFLAMLAHELRNPLAPIRNAVQIMRLTGGNADAVHSASEMMERQIGQMVRLVDDLLDVSRISRGKIELRRGRIELASAVNHAVEAIRPQCKSRDHALSVTLPPQPVYLNADPTRLAQVVGNLLNNACKFTARGGRIWLSVELEGGQAVIRVLDTGIGIAADQLPRIFEMFTQIDTSLERAQSGLGIGLMLVRELV
jgi:PAS domain S-box-containing protein